MALDVASCRSEREKLQWAFRLYDVDDSGSINLKEIVAIMETLEQVRGGRKMLSTLQGISQLNFSGESLEEDENEEEEEEEVKRTE